MTISPRAQVDIAATSPKAQARARVNRIRAGIEDVLALVVEAWQNRDHVTLGYATWKEYMSEEIGAQLRVPLNKRGEVVFKLRHAGMSLRALEQTTGVSKETVRRELATVPNETVETVTGVNGKRYHTSQQHKFAATDDGHCRVCGEFWEHTNHATEHKATAGNSVNLNPVPPVIDAASRTREYRVCWTRPNGHEHVDTQYKELDAAHRRAKQLEGKSTIDGQVRIQYRYVTEWTELQ